MVPCIDLMHGIVIAIWRARSYSNNNIRTTRPSTHSDDAEKYPLVSQGRQYMWRFSVRHQLITDLLCRDLILGRSPLFLRIAPPCESNFVEMKKEVKAKLYTDRNPSVRSPLRYLILREYSG